jgi:hypothetical protein
LALDSATHHDEDSIASIVRRAVWFVARPLLRAAIRLFDGSDPWENWPHAIPHAWFGSGSTYEFSSYFEGESDIKVRSLHEVCDWLAACEYVSDPDQFARPDYWQHPIQFEVVRKGDCEDHALWAWRKLHDLGMPARLVCGETQRMDGSWHGHAWVCFTLGDEESVLEATGARHEMIRPLSDVRSTYRPHVAVDHGLERHAYWGLMHYWRDND